MTLPPYPILPVHHIYRIVSDLALIFCGVVSFPNIARIANAETAIFFSKTLTVWLMNLVGRKNIQPKSNASVLFSYVQSSTYSQAISVGFPLDLDPSSKWSIMRKWTEWLNCCKLETVQFGKWQRKLKILRLLLIPFWLAVGTLTSKLQDARKSRVNRWRVQPRLPWSLTPWIQWRNFCD